MLLLIHLGHEGGVPRFLLDFRFGLCRNWFHGKRDSTKTLVRTLAYVYLVSHLELTLFERNRHFLFMLSYSPRAYGDMLSEPTSAESSVQETRT
jgi:hypothetical protein